MSVTRAEIDRMAALARLRLDGDEADRLVEEMNRILEHADRLRAEASGGSDRGDRGAAGAPGSTVDGEEIAGTRRDEPGSPDPLVRPPGDFAPRFEEGFFVVPPPHGVQAES